MADSSNPHNYPLKRNYQAAARLNLQHYLWKEQIGYLLHPSIPLTSDDLQIADVGTGTGIFLLDLLPSVPRTAHLTGLDIDTSLCPAPAYLPKNVTLRTHDIFDEIPEDLVEKFDIIHVRFFICVVEDDDPLPVLRNLIKMLKPSGYLQWSEQDFSTRHILQPSPSPTTPTPIPTIGLPCFAPHLPTLFATFSPSLTLHLTSRHTPPAHLLTYWQDMMLLSDAEVMGTLSPRAEAVKGMLKRTGEERERGEVARSDCLVVVGRKVGREVGGGGA